jgi:tripartite-type tricarboxylate transporter receptor subunit TctC
MGHSVISRPLALAFRIAAVACLVAFEGGRAPVRAAYPERPVTIVVPFVAGGGNDIVARILSEPLSQALGQPVVIENRGGAGGNIGFATVARAKPDGYTILMASSSFAINPSLYRRVPYHPINDFAPVADLVFFPNAIVVPSGSSADTISRFITAAKAKPGKMNYATPGNGTLPHLAVELLKLRAGLDITHVPYRGGGPAIQALIGGQIEVACIGMSAVLPQVRAGKLNVVAVTGQRRWHELPKVPTLVESGFSGLVAETWQGFLAPTGTPRPLIDRLAAELIRILQRPATREKFRNAGFGIVAQGPDALGTRIANERTKWREVIDKAKLQIN